MEQTGLWVQPVRVQNLLELQKMTLFSECGQNCVSSGFLPMRRVRILVTGPRPRNKQSPEPGEASVHPNIGCSSSILTSIAGVWFKITQIGQHRWVPLQSNVPKSKLAFFPKLSQNRTPTLVCALNSNFSQFQGILLSMSFWN